MAQTEASKIIFNQMQEVGSMYYQRAKRYNVYRKTSVFVRKWYLVIHEEEWLVVKKSAQN